MKFNQKRIEKRNFYEELFCDLLVNRTAVIIMVLDLTILFVKQWRYFQLRICAIEIETEKQDLDQIHDDKDNQTGNTKMIWTG